MRKTEKRTESELKIVRAGCLESVFLFTQGVRMGRARIKVPAVLNARACFGTGEASEAPVFFFDFL